MNCAFNGQKITVPFAPNAPDGARKERGSVPNAPNPVRDGADGTAPKAEHRAPEALGTQSLQKTQIDELTAKTGKRWHWLADIPHERVDASLTQLAVWHSTCDICGCPIFANAPVGATCEPQTKAFGRRNCPGHAGWRDAR